MSKEDLAAFLVEIRGRLEPAFGSDTAKLPTNSDIPSAGHCAVAAIVVSLVLDGGFASAIVNGESHWFSRIETEGGVFDVDVTGDQFRRHATQLAEAGMLYPASRERAWEDVDVDTLRRAHRFAEKARLWDVKALLRERLEMPGAPDRPTNQSRRR